MYLEDFVLLLGALGALLFFIIVSGIGAELWYRYSLREDKLRIRKALPVKKVIPEAAARDKIVYPDGREEDVGSAV